MERPDVSKWEMTPSPQTLTIVVTMGPEYSDEAGADGPLLENLLYAARLLAGRVDSLTVNRQFGQPEMEF